MGQPVDESYRIIHNAHDIVGGGIPISVHGSGSYDDARLVILREGQDPKKIATNTGGNKGREPVAKGWAALKRSTQIDDWQYVPAVDAYVPSSVDLSNLRHPRGLGSKRKLFRVSGKPVEYGPCGESMAADMGRWTSFSTCWRPRESADGTCSFHRKVGERAAAKEAEWRGRWAEQDRQRDRAEENRKRAREALAVLRAALEPLGILPDTITADEHVELPAEVAEAVAQWLVEYEDLRNL